MSNYKNGPGNVPRLPDRVVDTLVDAAGVSRLACGPRNTAIDQTAQVDQLVHDVAEELLARLPSTSRVSDPAKAGSTEDDLAWTKESLKRHSEKLAAVWKDLAKMIEGHTGERCSSEPFNDLDVVLANARRYYLEAMAARRALSFLPADHDVTPQEIERSINALFEDLVFSRSKLRDSLQVN